MPRFPVVRLPAALYNSWERLPLPAFGGVKPVVYLWAAPNTLLGLAFLLPTFATGGGVRLRAGVLEVHGGFCAWFLKRVVGLTLPGGAAAMTLGHVVLGLDPVTLDDTRAHERVHVRQCERWGPAVPAGLRAGIGGGVVPGARRLSGKPVRAGGVRRRALSRVGISQRADVRPGWPLHTIALQGLRVDAIVAAGFSPRGLCDAGVAPFANVPRAEAPRLRSSRQARGPGSRLANDSRVNRRGLRRNRVRPPPVAGVERAARFSRPERDAPTSAGRRPRGGEAIAAGRSPGTPGPGLRRRPPRRRGPASRGPPRRGCR